MSPTRSAAFFDLDKTIIAKSSTLAFSKPFFQGGLLSRRAVLRSAYANFMFGINGADHDQLERMRAYLTQMVTGWDVEVVRQSVAETLHSIIDPLVYEEAVDLIEEHQAAGRDVVIVSASGSEVVEPIGEMLGVDHVIATTLLVENGRYTGDVDFYAYGPNKAVAMERLAAERGYDLAESYAYSDSETDAPMLQAVGHPFAVNPDKALRRIAEDNGWPILAFGRPVALRRRLGLHTKVGKAAAVTVVASAIGAITMALVSRRKHRVTA
ncbi:HAD family phosphatase [Aeromicrobium sp. 9AM]|uniref:HAD family hydrolase n=1 Tax=Aeromicrobium sp. 9AM TaxID=2653126 RepID=UPI0012F26A7B|nr:HAD-IB family hydrolase [Aeromicrobium sp. 9AM]VXB47821.1 Inhibition of morphological differentiation protein [Aeromicrobium sp. 9AM]